jgi:hypothetical protein
MEARTYTLLGADRRPYQSPTPGTLGGERYARWKASRDLLTRLDAAWRGFTQSYAGLSHAKLVEPGVTETWSVKDIIAHVTTWEEEALKHVPVVLAGGRPPRYSVTYGGIDAFNARMTDQKKDLTLSEVLEQQETVHQRLIALVEGLPADQLGGKGRVRRRLRLDTYGHYPIHASAIRQWREHRA